MSTSARGILVTGSHRSGSTWAGRLLAAADGHHYVHEPFNIVARLRWMPSPPAQFLYLTEATAGPWEGRIERVVELRPAVLRQALPALRNGRARRLAGLARDAAAARRRGDRPVIKDPIALFSTEYLVDRFDLQPVVLVRDPVAFVGSLKARDWTFDFSHWSRQPALIDDLLPHLRREILAAVDHPGDIIEQGILQWNAFYSVVDAFRDRHPSWAVVRYETLAADPATEIPALFDKLGLRFGPAQQAVLDELTTGELGRSAIDVRRDSAAAVDTWRARLSDAEIAEIVQRTSAVADRFGIPDPRTD